MSCQILKQIHCRNNSKLDELYHNMYLFFEEHTSIFLIYIKYYFHSPYQSCYKECRFINCNHRHLFVPAFFRLFFLKQYKNLSKDMKGDEELNKSSL